MMRWTLTGIMLTQPDRTNRVRNGEAAHSLQAGRQFVNPSFPSESLAGLRAGRCGECRDYGVWEKKKKGDECSSGGGNTGRGLQY